MKLYKKILLLLMFIFTLFLLQNNSYAGSQKWNSLNYDVNVQENGDMKIVETWDIYISETNTLFEQFDINSEKYSNITNVKVYEITNNGEKELEQIYEEQYHVMPGCFYALITSSGVYEIAWNVGLEDSSDNRIYKICYTVEDAVKVYNDCSELYWMFLKDTNTIAGKNITGTITLPNEIKNIDDLRIWGHGPLNAEIKKEDKNKVSFFVPTLKKNESLEVRVVSEENVFEGATILYEDKLDDILKEEQIWADNANMLRETARKKVKIIISINIIIAITFIILIILTIKKGKMNLTLEYETYDIKYFRDIPNEEEATPARALYMKLFNGKDCLIDMGKIFAGTILDLVLKGIIEIEPIDSKTAKFKLKTPESDKKLTEDENLIYTILKAACEEKSSNTITTKELEEYCKKNYEAVYAKRKELEKVLKKYGNGKINKDKKNLQKKYSIKGIIYLFITCFSIGLIIYFPAFVVGFAILCIINLIYENKVEVLTETAYREKKEWNALQKYMEEFSLLKDKEIPDLILWEKYLVYATTFGIAKKVIKQLKIVYPQLIENSTYMNGNYMYLYYISNSSYGFDFFDNLDKTLSSSYRAAESAYTVAHSLDSSGSGGGGGFSSGGRRRRRWRKLRWSLKYATDMMKI